MTLSPEIAEILTRATITGNHLIVPRNPDGSMLPREVYTRVDKALRAAGARWNTKAQAHIFQSDARERLGLILTGEKVVDDSPEGVAAAKKKTLQQFYTPEALADLIAQRAGVSGHRVLEPSAGHGALAQACLRHGATFVQCVDINPDCKTLLTRTRFGITIADFLQVKPEPVYPRIVMNPPFTRGQDIRHVAHALKFLKPKGRLVSVMAGEMNLARLKTHTADIRFVCSVIPLPEGSFKEAGTNVKTSLLTIQL